MITVGFKLRKAPSAWDEISHVFLYQFKFTVRGWTRQSVSFPSVLCSHLTQLVTIRVY